MTDAPVLNALQRRVLYLVELDQGTPQNYLRRALRKPGQRRDKADLILGETLDFLAAHGLVRDIGGRVWSITEAGSALLDEIDEANEAAHAKEGQR